MYIRINGVPQIIAALVKLIHYKQNDPNLTIYIPNLRKQIGNIMSTNVHYKKYYPNLFPQIGDLNGDSGVGYITTDNVKYGDDGCGVGLNTIENDVYIVRNENDPLVHNTVEEPCATVSPYRLLFDDPLITFDSISIPQPVYNDGIHVCNENITPEKLTIEFNTMKLRGDTKKKAITMIKRDLIPRNSLQLYHTEASKSESQSINVNAVEKELQEMKIFKHDVSGHA